MRRGSVPLYLFLRSSKHLWDAWCNIHEEYSELSFLFQPLVKYREFFKAERSEKDGERVDKMQSYFGSTNLHLVLNFRYLFGLFNNNNLFHRDTLNRSAHSTR